MTSGVRTWGFCYDPYLGVTQPVVQWQDTPTRELDSWFDTNPVDF